MSLSHGSVVLFSNKFLIKTFYFFFCFCRGVVWCLWQTPEQDEVLQSIDRAIEGIHNVALKNGGKYNLEQRDVLQ